MQHNIGRSVNEVFGKGVAKERTVSQWFEKLQSGDYDHENVPRGYLS